MGGQKKYINVISLDKFQDVNVSGEEVWPSNNSKIFSGGFRWKKCGFNNSDKSLKLTYADFFVMDIWDPGGIPSTH